MYIYIYIYIKHIYIYIYIYIYTTLPVLGHANLVLARLVPGERPEAYDNTTYNIIILIILISYTYYNTYILVI